MKKLLTFASCCISLGLAPLVHAESTLSVINKASDTTIEITNDTVCSGDFYIYPNDTTSTTRWTLPLHENPIPLTYNEENPVTARWLNCAIIAQDMFSRSSDHSNMFVTINDLKSGESGTYRFHVVKTKKDPKTKKDSPTIKHIEFAGRKYDILMTHYGYDYTSYSVQSTTTTITVQEVNDSKS